MMIGRALEHLTNRDRYGWASRHTWVAGERPGLVVLTIELEGALSKTPGATIPCKLTSPYRAPLTKFLNKYSTEAIAYFLEFNRLQVLPTPSLPSPSHSFQRIGDLTTMNRLAVINVSFINM